MTVFEFQLRKLTSQVETLKAANQTLWTALDQCRHVAGQGDVAPSARLEVIRDIATPVLQAAKEWEG